MLCIAIAVFATVVSAVDVAAPTLVLAAAWQVVPIQRAAVIHRDDQQRKEQTSALLASAAPRPPPQSVVTA